MLVFSPSGVRAPQRPQQAGSGKPAVQGEPYWEEALSFTRQNFLQRDVDVEVAPEIILACPCDKADYQCLYFCST